MIKAASWIVAAPLILFGGCLWIERNWPADLYRDSLSAECRLVTTAPLGRPARDVHAICGRDTEYVAFWSQPDPGPISPHFLKAGQFRPLLTSEFRRLVGSKYWKGDGDFPLPNQVRLRVALDGDRFLVEQEYDRDEWRRTTVSSYTTDGRDIAWLRRDYYDQNCFTYRVLDRERIYGKGS